MLTFCGRCDLCTSYARHGAATSNKAKHPWQSLIDIGGSVYALWLDSDCEVVRRVAVRSRRQAMSTVAVRDIADGVEEKVAQ